MSAFLILVVLALGLTVVLQALEDLLPLRTPAALSRTVAIAVGAGLAWLLGYSAFAAFGQDLRAEWMHPVATGVALVAVGELVRALVGAIASRGAAPAAGAVSADRSSDRAVRAA
jgi:hypothetical protein